MANLGDISKIKLLNGNVVNIKDTTARTQANWNTNNGVKNAATVNSASKTNSGYFFHNNLGWVIKANEEYYIEFDFEKTAGDATVQLTKADGNIISTTSVACGSSSSGHVKRKVTPNVDAYGYNAYFNATGTITISNLMIYPAFITDDTFEPYALPNTKITPELIELVDSGAKNILDYTVASGSTTGLSWTVNSDNSITVQVTGTHAKKDIVLKTFANGVGNNMVLSGCPSGGNISTGFALYAANGTTAAVIATDTGNGVSLSYNNIMFVSIVINANVPNGTYTFKPMICSKSAWDVSQKFVPYRPTYEETVEQVDNLTPTVKDSGNAFTVGTDYTLCDACTLTVPIPTKGVKAVHIMAGLAYNSSAPRGIILSLSNSSADFNTSSKMLAKVESSDYIRLTAECFYYNYGGSNVNIYVWAKSISSGYNRVVSSMQPLN